MDRPFLIPYHQTSNGMPSSRTSIGSLNCWHLALAPKPNEGLREGLLLEQTLGLLTATTTDVLGGKGQRAAEAQSYSTSILVS